MSARVCGGAQAAAGVKAEELRFVFAQRLLSDAERVDDAGIDAGTGAEVTAVLCTGKPVPPFAAPAPPASDPASEAAKLEADEALRAIEEADEAARLAASGPVTGPVPLEVRLGSGRLVPVTAASPDEPMGALLGRVVSHPELRIPAARAAFLFAGKRVQPDATPASLGLRPHDRIQLMQAAVSLTAKPSAAELVFACRHCAAPDAPMQLRPLCPRCESEAVQVTAGSCAVGAVRWEQLLGLRVECFECGAANVSAATGFLCCRKDPATGKLCPSRRVVSSDASLKHRQFSYVFDGSSRQALFAALQRAAAGQD